MEKKVFIDYRTKVSNCCGALTYQTDTGICPDCKEHCTFEDLDLEDTDNEKEM